jgi:uncharacterized membrane protein (UPF0127 family)
MKKHLSLSRLHAFVPLALALHAPYPVLQDGQVLPVKIGSKNCKKGQIFQTAVAKTPASLQRGLGFRKNPLAKDEAMLFLFEEPTRVDMWMKDTYIPLDVVFFDAKGKGMKGFYMPVEKDPKDPKKIYSSEMPALLSIELPPKAVNFKKPGNLYMCIDMPDKDIKAEAGAKAPAASGAAK